MGFFLFAEIMKSFLSNPIERMLQGLVYWLAYRDVVSKNRVVEAVAVDEAFKILQMNIPTGYEIVREYPYKKIDSTFGNKHSDLAIVNANDECECLIEFKLADATNGGYIKDVDKLQPVKEAFHDIDCLVIVLYRKSCYIDEPEKLVLPNGKARKKVLVINKARIIIRRVFSALRSLISTKMKRVICIEVV